MKNQTLFITDLLHHVQGDVLTDDLSLGIYATDASLYQILPEVVVCPRDEQDVIKALEIARDHKVAVLPRGGGTSLAGQTVGKAMVLDFSKYMNQLIEVNPAEKWVRVQPGLVRDHLNNVLANHGLIFAPDPATSSRACVGGMVGNNSSGTKSILYGKTVDHVLEMKIALASGQILNLESLAEKDYEKKCKQDDIEGNIYRRFKEIIAENKNEIEARFPKVMRRVGGYNLDEFLTENFNLSKLITGSEGTLATILEVKLNLEKLPAHKSVCVVHFETVMDAIKSVKDILSFRPSAVEILDETVITLSRKNLTALRSNDFIEGTPGAVLIVEFFDENKERVLQRPKDMAAFLKEQQHGYAYPIFGEGQTFNNVWTIRKKGLGLMLGVKGNKKPIAFIEDAAIPVEVLPAYIEAVVKVCDKYETKAAVYAHASVGVLHVRPILDMRLAEDIQRFKNIADETFELVKKYGGSWSGEHGDGLVRSPYNERFFGKELYHAFRQVKALFDPEGRMNPGKIIEAPAMEENLRYGTKYKDDNFKGIYQYREDGSFHNAVHMCNGVGACRKTTGGTMCPSFRATRQEEHSTRGRANALRLAMSGQLKNGLQNDRLFEALDLCLSCKACKSECPSNVDMAKLKSELWQHRFDENGINFRDRLIRDSAKMAGLLSGKKASLVNKFQQSNLFKNSLEKLAGIDKRRTLPAYAKTTFAHWYRKNYKTINPEGKRVALFCDTYLNYHEPQIGIAATKLLQKLGYEVLLAEGCCQRPKISNGFLREAKAEGTKLAMHYQDFFNKEIPVLVCEPSCASALQDDLPDLMESPMLANKMKTGVFLLENFLAKELMEGNCNSKIAISYKALKIHGHCHQKALYGTGDLIKILQKLTGVAVTEIPSGCCGMAGSFGYEKEHYDLSKKIGEEVLFPAILETDEDTGLIACGFSCRHQIKDFTGRRAMHWVEVFQF